MVNIQTTNRLHSGFVLVDTLVANKPEAHIAKCSQFYTPFDQLLDVRGDELGDYSPALSPSSSSDSDDDSALSDSSSEESSESFVHLFWN